MFASLFLAVLSLAGLFRYSTGANILILHPMAVKSLLAFMRPISRGLAERNHSVTVVSSDENGFNRDQMEVILTHNLSYVPIRWDTSHNFFQDMNRIHRLSMHNSRTFLSSAPMRKLMTSNRKFDAVIVNTIFIHSLSTVSHQFNASLIDFGPQGEHPYSCIYSGNEIRTGGYDKSTPLNQNFLNRAVNTLKVAVLLLYRELIMIPDHQKLVDDLSQVKGYESRPQLKKLLFKKSLILANSHPTLSVSNYVSWFQKDVAGISIEPQSLIPDVYEKFISKSISGFILLSWGSVLPSPTGDTAGSIIEALSRLPYQVIWKVSTANLGKNIPDNVMLSSWVPQQTLIGDKRIKLLWTHGGFSSMVEAVHYALPVVVTPAVFDQPRNAALMVKRNMGLELSIDNLTADSIHWTINEVINNPKYKEGARKLSKEFKSRPIPPLDEAIFWIEHAITFKDFIPTDDNHTIALFVWQNLDVFVVTILCLIAFAACFCLVFKFIYCHIRQKCAPREKVLEPVKFENVLFYQTCVESWPNEELRILYAAAVLMVQAVIPAAVVGCIHAKIASYLNAHASTQKDSRRAQRELTRNKRTTMLLSGVAVLFTVSWLPLGLVSLIIDMMYPISPIEPTPSPAPSDQVSSETLIIICAVSHIIAMTTAISNPVVYGWLNSNIRRELLSLISNRFCRRVEEDENNRAPSPTLMTCQNGKRPATQQATTTYTAL